MTYLVILLALLLPATAGAESLVATRLIRATDIIGPADIVMQAAQIAGAATRPDHVIGLEARVAIYPGRPVRMADLGPAAVIERNEIVRMVYRNRGLMILSEGRALGRAGLGDPVTVMNLSSRQTVQAVASGNGLVEVGLTGKAAASAY
ncbi:MAG: flagellar basal body P-ring formation chaperone FlgA [Roseinatronobacter sp.]